MREANTGAIEYRELVRRLWWEPDHVQILGALRRLPLFQQVMTSGFLIPEFGEDPWEVKAIADGWAETPDRLAHLQHALRTECEATLRKREAMLTPESRSDGP